jgi:ligand-binding SRPBCC domain-containing protein
MSEPVVFEISSDLAASRHRVWSSVSTMDGVNAELMPLVRMTYPPERWSLDDQRLEPGVELFRSWLLVAGFIPFDRHVLTLVEVDPGAGFVEESRSWLQRRWRHERTLEDLPGGHTRVTDRVVATPVLGVARPLVGMLVPAVFRHRHRRLRRRFGST